MMPCLADITESTIEALLKGQVGFVLGILISGIVFWKYFVPALQKPMDKQNEQFKEMNEKFEKMLTSNDRLSESIAALILGSTVHTPAARSKAEFIIKEIEDQHENPHH